MTKPDAQNDPLLATIAALCEDANCKAAAYKAAFSAIDTSANGTSEAVRAADAAYDAWEAANAALEAAARQIGHDRYTDILAAILDRKEREQRDVFDDYDQVAATDYDCDYGHD